jgi:tRNA(Ile)-lysidine synthase
VGPAPSVAEVRRAVRVALGSRPVLVACSGGADSLALAAATAFEASRAGVQAGLVTVDHGLQPGSAEQAAHVAGLGHDLGLDPVLTLTVTVGTAGGPEAAARTARYATLHGLAQRLGADVLLGHTLDDQAETVLLGLGRGSGPRSITGMAAADPPYLRPLLGLRRATTEAACAALGLTPWADPHNADPRFQRVRLRTQVLPLLDEVLQGGVAPALARTAGLLRDDLEALDRWAEAALAAATPCGDQQRPAVVGGHSSAVDHLEVGALADLPRAVRTRVLRAWTQRAGAGPLSAERTAALDALVTEWHGQGPVPLPGAIDVRRESGRLEAHPRARPQE